jgi:hypothetical protein
MTKKHYRISENGEVYCTLKAYDVDDALEKTYDDEIPGNMVDLTVEVYQEKKDRWKTVWYGRI